MARGHFLVAAVVSCLVAIVPLIASLLSREWYVVLSISNSFSMGLNSFCTADAISPTAARSGAATLSVVGASDASSCDSGDDQYATLQWYMGAGLSGVVGTRGFANAATSTTLSPSGNESSPTTTTTANSIAPYPLEPLCDRDTNVLKQRYTTIKGLIIASAAVAFFSGIIGAILLFSQSYNIVLRIVNCVIGLAAFGLAVAVVAIYPLTVEKWLFCDARYCDVIGDQYQDCASYFGYGYVLLGCGAGLLLVHFLATLAANISAWESEQKSLLPPTFEDDADGDGDDCDSDYDSTEKSRGLAYIVDSPPPPSVKAEDEYYIDANGRRRRRYPNQPPLPVELQDGDWEYDPDSGYFWSEENSLYFEPTTQQFYDPHSDAWFNPETELWYKPLVQGADDVLRPQGDISGDDDEEEEEVAEAVPATNGVQLAPSAELAPSAPPYQ